MLFYKTLYSESAFKQLKWPPRLFNVVRDDAFWQITCSFLSVFHSILCLRIVQFPRFITFIASERDLK